MKRLIPPVMMSLAANALAQPCAPYWTAGPVMTGQYAFSRFGGEVILYKAEPPRFFRYTATSWEPMSAEGIPTNAYIASPMVLDDGQGPRLYALARMSLEVLSGHRWNGVSWDPMPPEFHSWEWSPIGSADMGNGSVIYGRRGWNTTPTIPKGIARWNGTGWEQIATANFTDNIAGCLAFNGSLYVFGTSSVVNGATITSGVARWDCTTWSDPWPSMQYMGERLQAVTYDDGSGPALYVLGMTTAQGPPAVSRFDGQQWTVVGSTGPWGQLTWFSGLEVFDDGHGPALYIAGAFSTFAGVPASGVVRWDGQHFERLGAGTSARFMAAIQDVRGPALFFGKGPTPTPAGGGQVQSSALWVGCPNCYPNCDNSTASPAVNVADFTCFLQKYAARDPYANCSVDAVIDLADFTCFLQKYAAGCP